MDGWYCSGSVVLELCVFRVWGLMGWIDGMGSRRGYLWVCFIEWIRLDCFWRGDWEGRRLALSGVVGNGWMDREVIRLYLIVFNESKQ